MQKHEEALPKQLKLIFKSLLLCIIITGCDFFSDGYLKEDSLNSLRVVASSSTMEVGEMVYLSYSYTPSNASISPKLEYDDSILTLKSQNSNGCVVIGKEQGQTPFTVSAGGKSSTLLLTVSGYSDNYVSDASPYIYSNVNILQLTPGTSQRINVSLYNGTVNDNENYTWTIDNPSIATVSPNGQYCLIKALSEGYSRIKVTNTAAAYPYYIGVYVLTDYTNTTYITSGSNIVSVFVDGDEKTITCDLVNPKSETYKNNFSWEIFDGDTHCISISSNSNQCKIKSIKAGQCTVRVTNPEADNGIPLDFLVRSIEIVDSAYIEPSTTMVLLTDSTTEEQVTAEIAGLVAEKDYSTEEFVWEIENEELVNYWVFGNQINLTGLHNGSTSIYVSHPKVQKRRQILLICENQEADAVDASCYITTSQNYIKTKVGAEETLLYVTLKGGQAGNEKNFHWDILQKPDDGTNDVIKVETTNSNTYTSSRLAAQTTVTGCLHIKPVSEGTAVITVTNPKSYYSTEILVKVLSAGAVLEDPLYITGPGIVKFLNSASYDLTVSLNGNTKTAADEAEIIWSSESEGLNVVGNGTGAVLTSTQSGSHIYELYVSHPKVDNSKQIKVLTADTQEELDAIKCFYSDKTYYAVNAGSNVYINVEAVGFTDTEGNELDFSNINTVSWTSSDSSIFTVEKDESNPLTGVVTAIKAGTGKATIKYGDTTATFTVTVYPEGVNLSEVETTCYFTTTQNVIIMGQANTTATAKITAVGLPTKEYQNIVWISENENVATVIGNGLSATITAVTEGETVLSISHPMSENVLKIYVRIGSEYIIESTTIKYISVNTDVIAITKDSESYTLRAYLVNGSEKENNSGFSFSIEDESIARFVASYGNGYAYVKPVSAGQTEVTITHTATNLSKKVLVIIGNTAEELSEFKYLTTNQNVVTIIEGGRATLSVNIANSSEPILDGYTWESTSNVTASILATTTSSAVIVGNSSGTTIIKVSNSNCKYSLDIIVQVISQNLAASSPYIEAVTSILELTVSTSYTTVTADLIGGTDTDLVNFQWVSDDPGILEVYGQNGVGKVRAVGSGLTYLRISHPKAAYDQLVLCICSEASTSDCSISVSCGNIISLLPTASDQTITATLVNGTTTDRYNFTWSLDVYDVVDLTYSANTAIITPLKEGVAQLTVHHPKSPYDQTIVIKVQQYSTFAFGATNKTIEAGSTSYVSMQVPSTNVSCTITYTVDDPTVCTVTGTNAVCAITALSKGTTMISASLMAGSTVYATTSTKLLVTVTAAAAVTKYITSSTTIYTLDVGKSRTFTASLVGTEYPATDIYNLKWTTGNPSILKLSGQTVDSDGNYSITGNSCYGTALNSGETTLTISHPEVATDLVYHIIVPEESSKEITLNKNYVSIDKGSRTEIKATISGGSTSDYNNIVWTCDKVNGAEIISVMGQGQTVQLYGINSGSTYLYATTGDGITAKCQVVVEEPKKLSFTSTNVKVAPNTTMEVQFYMIPSDAQLTWQIMDTSGEEHFRLSGPIVSDSATGLCTLSVYGVKESTSSVPVYFTSSYGNTAQLNIMCDWDYKFNLSRSSISTTPDEVVTIKVTVNPAEAEVTFDDCSFANLNYESNGDGTGVITVTPLCESPKGGEVVNVYARNTTTDEQFAAKSLKLIYTYSNLHCVPTLKTSDGLFSRTDNSELYVGDGETAKFNLDFAEKGDYLIETAVFDQDGVSSEYKLSLLNNELTLISSYDYTQYDYKITSFKKPIFYKTESNPIWYAAGKHYNDYPHSTGDQRLWRVYDIGYDDDDSEYEITVGIFGDETSAESFAGDSFYIQEGCVSDCQRYEVPLDTFKWVGVASSDKKEIFYGLISDAVSSLYKDVSYFDDLEVGFSWTILTSGSSGLLPMLNTDGWLLEGNTFSSNKATFKTVTSLQSSFDTHSFCKGFWTWEYCDDEIVGNIMSAKEYSKNPYFYCPGTEDSYDSSSRYEYFEYPVNQGKWGINDKSYVNVSAFETNFAGYNYVTTTNQSLKDIKSYNVVLSVYHNANGTRETLSIPVHFEKYACSKDLTVSEWTPGSK